MEYKAIVNNSENHTVSVNDDGSATINGNEVDFDLSSLGENDFHLLLENRSYNVQIIKGKGKTINVAVNGKPYDVILEDQLDSLLKRLGMESKSESATKTIIAPMPGLVVDILVAGGAQVCKDDPLIVLEAMKMENILRAPADAVVKEISAVPNQSVEKNAVLITFE